MRLTTATRGCLLAGRRAPGAVAPRAAAARRAPARVVAFREDERKAAQQGASNPPPRASTAGGGGASIPVPGVGAVTLPMSRHAAAAIAMSVAAVGLAAYPQQVMTAMFGPVVTTSAEKTVARLLGTGLAMAAATNVAESRAGGRAGGPSEPVLEADTHSRLNRSLGAFGLLGVAAMALTFTAFAARLLPNMPALTAPLLSNAAVGVIGALGTLQWMVAGMPSPQAMVKGVFREFWGTPRRAPGSNINSASYAVLGAAFLAAGLAYMAAPAQTLAALFGGSTAMVSAHAAHMWQLVGAAVACVVAGACYTLKEGAGFDDLKETKFKWLNFALAVGSLAHVLMIAPLAMGPGGPLAPVLLATWGAAMLMGFANTFA